jgi:predicted phosphodiesterase
VKIGIIGDIHSNLEALTAVLKALDYEKVDEIVCVGDVVGYGADPVACLKLVRERASAVVAGNHDFGVVRKCPIDYFNSAAREAILWTATQLSEEDRWWISNLPLIYTTEQYQLVHSSLEDPESFPYIFNPEEAAPSFEKQNRNLAFFGHTHWPATFIDGEPIQHSLQKTVPLEPPAKMFINVGSVGQPRDSVPDSSCVVVDFDRKRVEFKRVPYDIARTAGKIIRAGLPASLAERLFVGY